MVDTWVIIESIGISDRCEFTKVLVSSLVLRQKNKMPAPVGTPVLLFYFLRSAIGLCPKYRLKILSFQFIYCVLCRQSLFIRGIVFGKYGFIILYFPLDFSICRGGIVSELQDTKHITMVCKSHRIHSATFAFLNQVGYFRHSVKNREMGVHV